MAEHNLLGKAGEDAAVDYLERHDYVIRHRNCCLLYTSPSPRD